LKKKRNILIISTLFTTFIHNQVTELLQNDDYNIFTVFPIDLYQILRHPKSISVIRGKYLSDKIPAGKFRYCYYFTLPFGLLGTRYLNFIIKQIRKLLKGRSIDLIHAHTLLNSGYPALKISEELNVPLIVTTHGTDFYRCIDDKGQFSRFPMYSKEQKSLIDQVLKHSSKIIAVSDQFKNDILSYSENADIGVIENSYNEKIFFPLDKRVTRKRINFSEDKLIILSVGYYIPKKGHLYLLDAIDQVRRFTPEVHLILIGGGEMYGDYVNRIDQLQLEDHVTLIKHLPQTELGVWYNSADIFVLPSINEPFGISLIEAMACGLPCISTSTQGPQNIISHEVNGLLIPVKDTQAIADSLRLLIENPKLKEKIIENSIKLVKTRYLTQSSRILGLYKSIIDEKENTDS